MATLHEHASCVALIASLRETLQAIVDVTEGFLPESPAQDVYERAREALMLESGREVQKELALLRDIAAHAGQLYVPAFPLSLGQRCEQLEFLLAALDVYDEFQIAHLYVLRDKDLPSKKVEDKT
jgi:hypothetical protein